MSFRTRLTLFFLLIVIVPMISVGGRRVPADLRQRDGQGGRAARRGAGRGAGAVHGVRATRRQARGARGARPAARAGAHRPATPAVQRSATRRWPPDAGSSADGLARAAACWWTSAVASNADRRGKPRRRLARRAGRSGRPRGSPRSSRAATPRASSGSPRSTWWSAARGATLAATAPPFDGPTPLPTAGDVRSAATTTASPAFDGAELRQGRPGRRRVQPDGRLRRRRASRLLAIAAARAASCCSRSRSRVAVSRSLQAQIERLLDAARRLGGGDFSTEVPTEGNDEFAALGRGVQQDGAPARGAAARSCARARSGCRSAIRRVGESFASNLDRDGAARDRRADRGRRRRRGLRPRVDAPTAPARRSRRSRARRRRRGLRRRDRTPREAARAATPARPAEIALDGASALAAPAAAPPRRGDRVLGVDRGRPRRARRSPPRERELFNYLADQAAVSIENVDLHETVQRQAVTDELTGPLQPPPLPGGAWRARSSAPAASARTIGPAHARHRQLQARQRHLRPPAGRPRAARGRARAARVLARDRRARPLRRRGDGRGAARRPTSRARTSSPSASAPRSRRSSCRCSTAAARCGSPPRSAPPRCRGSADSDKDALVAAADAALYRAKRVGQEPHRQSAESADGPCR